MEVYQHTSFTSSNLLFQLEDRVSVRGISIPTDKLDHGTLTVPHIG